MSFIYGPVILLGGLALLLFVAGYIKGWHDRSVDVTEARLEVVKAQELTADAIAQLRTAEQRIASLTHPVLAGGPGRARATNHGGVTVIKAPNPIQSAGAEIVRLPTSHQPERNHA